MDLTVALIENPPSNGESNGAEDNGIIVRESKRDQFMATYHRQNFSMPGSFVFYIAKNPKTWKLYQKMVKTCKFFFVRNPILVIDKHLFVSTNDFLPDLPLLTSSAHVHNPYDMNQTTSKLWIAHRLTVFVGNSITAETKGQNIITSIIPKLYRCDVCILHLRKQAISYHDLQLLTSSAEMVIFEQVVVKHEDGSNVEVQKIVGIASNATCIYISHPTITSKTMEELLKIPNFPTLNAFILQNVAEVFDIEAFYVHMKKNKTTDFALCFDESISDEYMKRLDEITDETIATKEFVYKPALLGFRGLDYERILKLRDICHPEFEL